MRVRAYIIVRGIHNGRQNGLRRAPKQQEKRVRPDEGSSSSSRMDAVSYA